MESIDAIAAIRQELFRLRARPEDAGQVDGITVQDRSHGNAVLAGSVKRPDFNYFEAATEIHERLCGLPDDGGLKWSVRSSVKDIRLA